MEYRKLGTTGINVSIIGLGAEHLEHCSLDTIISVVDTALAGGVNYIDLYGLSSRSGQLRNCPEETPTKGNDSRSPGCHPEK
jgi:predicted aldo/keto reductase-like oxidoreductase